MSDVVRRPRLLTPPEKNLIKAINIAIRDFKPDSMIVKGGQKLPNADKSIIHNPVYTPDGELDHQALNIKFDTGAAVDAKYSNKTAASGRVLTIYGKITDYAIQLQARDSLSPQVQAVVSSFRAQIFNRVNAIAPDTNWDYIAQMDKIPPKNSAQDEYQGFKSIKNSVEQGFMLMQKMKFITNPPSQKELTEETANYINFALNEGLDCKEVAAMVSAAAVQTINNPKNKENPAEALKVAFEDIVQGKKPDFTRARTTAPEQVTENKEPAVKRAKTTPLQGTDKITNGDNRNKVPEKSASASAGNAATVVANESKQQQRTVRLESRKRTRGDESKSSSRTNSPNPAPHKKPTAPWR